MNHEKSCTCTACMREYEAFKKQCHDEFNRLKAEDAGFSRKSGLTFFEKIGFALFGDPRKE